jgi:hypothetical protein
MSHSSDSSKKKAPSTQQKTVPLMQPMSVAAAQKASKATPAPTVSTNKPPAPGAAAKAKAESSFSVRPLLLGLVAGLAIAAGVTGYRARNRLSADAPAARTAPSAAGSSDQVKDTAIAFGVSRGAASASISAAPPPAPPPPPPVAEALPPPAPPTSLAGRSDGAPDAGAKPRAGNAQANGQKPDKPEEPKKPPQGGQPTSVDVLLQQQLKNTIP